MGVPSQSKEARPVSWAYGPVQWVLRGVDGHSVIPAGCLRHLHSGDQGHGSGRGALAHQF